MDDGKRLTTADDRGGFVFRIWVKTYVAYCVCTRDEHVLASSCEGWRRGKGSACYYKLTDNINTAFI